MLRARILTALALLPALLAAMFLLPDRYWAAFVLVFVLVGAFEWSRLAAFSRPVSWLYVGLTLVLGIGLFPLAGAGRGGALPHLASLVFWAGIVPLWLAFGWRIRNRLVLAVVGWVVLLPTWLALVQLRALSPVLLLGLLAVIWVADSAAYFTGKAFGRHKLVPSISPGKTWEGVVGALAAVALYALLWTSVDSALVDVSADGLSARLLGILALWCMTYFGILGDLFESWMKRQAGLKDSGRIFPGHGGVLDRVDALTSTLPLAVLVLYWLNIPTFHS
jgi:phosphatidate cytidylyltransferase